MTFILLNEFSDSYLGAIRAFYLDQFPKRKTPYFAIMLISFRFIKKTREHFLFQQDSNIK